MCLNLLEPGQIQNPIGMKYNTYKQRYSSLFAIISKLLSTTTEFLYHYNVSKLGASRTKTLINTEVSSFFYL